MKVIGMISGTSYDGIDAACCEFTLNGEIITAEVIGFESFPYEKEVHSLIADAMPPRTTTMEQVCILDTKIGQEFARAADAINKKFNFAADLIVSHGQTLFHWIGSDNKAKGTLQLGEPTWIAQKTGVAVLSNVRSRDVAAGGHGAPLVSVLDQLMFGDSESPQGALNLGGISNITVASRNMAPLAYDIGPANGLLDAAIMAFTKSAEKYDNNGELASQGSVNDSILNQMLAHPYYSLPWPKSTGKEIFHLPYIIEHFGEVSTWKIQDVLATLLELTVETVARDVEAHQLTTLYVAGGGTNNAFMMKRLATRLTDCSVKLMSDLGVDPRAKEGLMFALIGFLSAHGLAGAIPSCTGASSAEILGSFTPGAKPLSLPKPVTSFPKKLVMKI